VGALKAATEEILRLYRRSINIPKDVRAADQVSNLARRTFNELPRINILGNNVSANFESK